jgi:hypothetical protein
VDYRLRESEPAIAQQIDEDIFCDNQQDDAIGLRSMGDPLEAPAAKYYGPPTELVASLSCGLLLLVGFGHHSIRFGAIFHELHLLFRYHHLFVGAASAGSVQ